MAGMLVLLYPSPLGITESCYRLFIFVTTLFIPVSYGFCLYTSHGFSVHTSRRFSVYTSHLRLFI